MEDKGKSKAMTNEDELSSITSSVASVVSRDAEPIPITSGNAPEFNSSRRRSSLASLGSLLHTLSGTSSTSNLSRYTTDQYLVDNIYEGLNQDAINLRRTATRNTILETMTHRVDLVKQTTEHDIEKVKSPEILDEEENIYSVIPDVSAPAKDFGGEFSQLDPELISWEGPDDPEYPRNWSRATKIHQTFIVALYTLISPMSSSVLSPAMGAIAKDFGIHGSFLEAFTVSIMVLAWALGPLIIAPISESDSVGRKPVLNVSIWIVFIFNLAASFSKLTVQLCVFRFLAGLGGCAPLNVGAGCLSDLFSDSDRQLAMAFYSVCPSIGPIISPIISSFILQGGLKWRWCFWVLTIFNGAVAVYGTIFFTETYSPRLLKDKAKKLRKETNNEHLHTIYEMTNGGETMFEKFLLTATRPIYLLATNPMISGLGSFMAFVYGFMYLMIVTFPTVFGVGYGFKTSIMGLMYLPLGLGFIIGTAFWTVMIDKVYTSKKAKNGGVAKPEFRLPCLVFSGVGVPIGLIWYGWSAQKRLHWIMPALGMGIFGFFFVAVFQTIQNYLIDMNNRFAASSVAAAAVFRSIFGFAFPLFAHAMYSKLNYGWGNTMCALIGLALGIPFPLFCLAYGERLRGWANTRMERDQAIRDKKKLERIQKDVKED
ncbi:uncharacterized protein KQ657_002531 [Scheffersomyces spartinae]|uniref:Major facilitator superfamily (MFS) profile domain-containing protein n=1 Tax=Scheffersomyces spartinae TaxID=45513 RepID=A0A9P7V6P0_9ASCO|nr:uncharacterized protein KQ657_002531 [Scheffersomyces spartinae]KAG7192166.1 hypothetical protein KQ657_002531 [Scheffersomyces spartinae]